MDLFIAFTRFGVAASKCKIKQHLPYCSKYESEKVPVLSTENCITKYKVQPTNLCFEVVITVIETNISQRCTARPFVHGRCTIHTYRFSIKDISTILGPLRLIRGYYHKFRHYHLPSTQIWTYYIAIINRLMSWKHHERSSNLLLT